MSLKSRVIKTELINWRKLKFFQSDKFKDFEKEAEEKLKTSILENNFAQPFYVWESPAGDIYCLDGKHRTLILERLISDGHEVPDMLPATFIFCETKSDAAKLVLVYSSLYATVNNQGLFDFIKEFDLLWDDIKLMIELPEFSFDRFEQKFIVPTDDREEPEIDIPDNVEVKVSPGDIFQLGEHRLFCGDFKSIEILMFPKKGRIVITDPPYNLRANEFTNKGKVQHDDFAMGGGEMSDEEFAGFLTTIMETGKSNTVNGSIHFIFMDWRHIWHMTEASRKAYGSCIPKQLVVWNKDIMANGSFYRAKHELCFIFKSGTDKHCSHIDLPDRIRTNVWDYPSANSLRNPDRKELSNHPTPKTVAMIADAILDTTNEGDIVIDFFLGSGTALIASEETKRICYATEIEPKFVQSAIIRYINYCNNRNYSPIFKHLNGNLTLKDFTNGQTA